MAELDIDKMLREGRERQTVVAAVDQEETAFLIEFRDLLSRYRLVVEERILCESDDSDENGIIVHFHRGGIEEIKRGTNMMIEVNQRMFDSLVDK